MNNIFGKKITSFITAAAIAASVAVMPISAMAFDAPAADDGAAQGISNGGEWSIYASKIGQIKANSGTIEDASNNGIVEVTKNARSAALQFDLSTMSNNTAAGEDKVIKSAKLRLTPVVTKSNLKQTISVISNEFTDTTEKTPIAEFTVPRVGNDDFNKTNVKDVTVGTAYPSELKNWQADIDITGEVISAGNTLSLHVAYASGNTGKSEYATCNIASNSRLNGGLVPFLYSDGAATDYSKWVYPQIVLTYADEADYKSAYNDFVTASGVLADAVITAKDTVSAPEVTGGSTVTLETADNTGIVTITDNTIAYNTKYAGNAKTANIKITVTKGDASYSKVVPVTVDAVEAYAVSFDAAKNPKGEVSVTVGGTAYTDGTAYAQEGAQVTVNAAPNTGYTETVTVKKVSDDSSVEVTGNSFTMPAEAVNVSVEYAKSAQYGETRIAASNSVSIQKNGTIQSPNLVIGGDRLTFVKFDLSEYDAASISIAELAFTLTKNAGLNTKAVFCIPNDTWDESGMSKAFQLDGTPDTDISNFKYTNTAGEEATVNLTDNTSHADIIMPNADDASSAAQGIFKDYYIASTGTQKGNSINVADAMVNVLADNTDGIVTFMIYSAGGGNDEYSVNAAPSLAERPSLIIAEEDPDNRSYAISFDTNKNPKGEISVISDGITYTDGTAYAKEGSVVKVIGANTGYIANITVKKSDNSEVTVTNGSFIMPAEAVSVSAEYTKSSFGTTRVAAANSISIKESGLQSPNLVIGADRVTFVKFDLSGYNADIISEADMNFTLTKNATLNTKAVFYVPNNNWNESNMSKEFCFDGTADTAISNFKYGGETVYTTEYAEDGIIIVATYNTDGSLAKVELGDEVKADGKVKEIDLEPDQKSFVWTSLDAMKPVSTKQTETAAAGGAISLLNGENHQALIVPNTDDASTAQDGILKDYYVASTGTQKTNTISITDAVKKALKDSDDGIVTFMVYSAGGGNDVYSVNGAESLASRPSLTITESAEFLPDNELITEIKTAEDLETFAAIVNGGNSYEGKTVTLANDLDLSEKYNSAGESWTPIGTETSGGLKTFAGTFDGHNSTVSGLYINDSEGSVLGLFGDISGTVKNLTVTGEINGSSVVGGIAASCDGAITNCYSNVAITARREAGGICGTLSNGGIIADSDNRGSITVTNKETYAGGIAGHNIDGLIKDCNNSGKIENGTDGFRNSLGGIVGFLDNGRIENGTNTGDVISSATVASYTADRSQNYVGGITGYSSYGTVINSSNSGLVSNAVDYAGGIVGYLNNGDTISGCTNNGSVSADNHAEGIIGFINGRSTVENCINNGTVTTYPSN